MKFMNVIVSVGVIGYSGILNFSVVILVFDRW